MYCSYLFPGAAMYSLMIFLMLPLKIKRNLSGNPSPSRANLCVLLSPE